MITSRPSDVEVLACAGSATTGRLLVRGDAGRLCMAVVDTNDDGAFLVVVTLHLDDDGVWRESGWSSAPVAGEGHEHGVRYRYGRAPAPSGVLANENGWWLLLGEADTAGGTAD